MMMTSANSAVIVPAHRETLRLDPGAVWRPVGMFDGVLDSENHALGPGGDVADAQFLTLLATGEGQALEQDLRAVW